MQFHRLTSRATKTNRIIEGAIAIPYRTKLCSVPTFVLTQIGILFDKPFSDKVYNQSGYYGNNYHFNLTHSCNDAKDATCKMAGDET